MEKIIKKHSLEIFKIIKKIDDENKNNSNEFLTSISKDLMKLDKKLLKDMNVNFNEKMKKEILEFI